MKKTGKKFSGSIVKISILIVVCALILVAGFGCNGHRSNGNGSRGGSCSVQDFF